jgi:hypothetical protein
MLGATALADFRSALRGSVLVRGDPEYDATRQLFNAMIDHRPTLVARCSGAADVVASVGFARAHGLAVSVRGGGHNVSGKAVVDDGLMIDLAPMKSCRIDRAGLTSFRAGPIRQFDGGASIRSGSTMAPSRKPAPPGPSAALQPAPRRMIGLENRRRSTS